MTISVKTSASSYYKMLKAKIKHFPEALEILKSDDSDINKVFAIEYNLLGDNFCNKRSSKFTIHEKIAMAKPIYELVGEHITIKMFYNALTDGSNKITNVNLDSILSGTLNWDNLIHSEYELSVNSDEDRAALLEAREAFQYINKYENIIRVGISQEFNDLVSTFCNQPTNITEL